jgi:2-methylisocitrate lyase-like PEP mutase family enzyme
MAQTPDFSKSYGSAVSNALMIAQTRKTNAEATIVEDHQNQAKLESELYGSGVGMFPTFCNPNQNDV